MNFDGNFIKIGEIDVSLIKKKVIALNDEWHMSTWRQERFPTHTKTRTIELMFDRDFRHENPTKLDIYKDFEQELVPLMELLELYYREYSASLGLTDNVYMIRLLLVDLLPGGSIIEHLDSSYTLAHSHRIHLPITTSDSVEFTVGGVKKNLKKGEIWEINNRHLHGVENRGISNRVHIIIDWVIDKQRCCCGSRWSPNGHCSKEACRSTAFIDEPCRCYSH